MQGAGAGGLKKIVHDDGEGPRALRGYVLGESPDGLFFIVQRPLGDEVWLAKSSVRSIEPAGIGGRT
jgi:hypothetical protein